MLSRIAKGLFDLGQAVERAQQVAQILEVNHKMNLERGLHDEEDVWRTISEAFGCKIEAPDERKIYECLVLSDDHPYSVRRGIEQARFEGRAMREHISEEMWLHLNHTYLKFKPITFESIVASGRSEFNQRVRIFSDALVGLTDDTMIRGEAWAFLKVGKLSERASMICKVLKIREAAIIPEQGGAPVDVHQWQTLLRSLSGYEPYRRAYDARIDPNRVLDFVLKRGDFPRSLTGCLCEMRRAVAVISAGSQSSVALDLFIARFLEDLRLLRSDQFLENGTLPAYLDDVDEACREMEQQIKLTFFSSLRPAFAPESCVSSIQSVVPQ